MKSSPVKTILFGKVTEGKTVRQWPIAVFVNRPAAAAFAKDMKLLAKMGDVESLRASDPHHPISEDGKVTHEVTYSAAEISYNPTVVFADAPDALEPENVI
jgi:hypothetical protein